MHAGGLLHSILTTDIYMQKLPWQVPEPVGNVKVLLCKVFAAHLCCSFGILKLQFVLVKTLEHARKNFGEPGD